MATLTCLVLAATGLTACQDAFTLPKSDVDYCTIIADPPLKVGKGIQAPGHFRCDGKGADSITFTVKLQKQSSNGSWHTLHSATFVARGTNTSRKLTDSQRTRHVSGSCSSGKFQSVVRAVEHSHGHSQVYNSHSVTVPNPCNKSF